MQKLKTGIIEAGDRNHVTIGTMVQRRFDCPYMRLHESIMICGPFRVRWMAGKAGKLWNCLPPSA